ncbi:MAG TPA: hypothetical protein DCF71_03355 [Gemmatimonadetes bacterium]|nr:hypothetical protein [Gemmatimonadota bacterium]
MRCRPWMTWWRNPWLDYRSRCSRSGSRPSWRSFSVLSGYKGCFPTSSANARREIGMRLALGAEPAQVRRMVVTQGAKLASVGMLGGLIASVGLTRLLQGLLYGTEPLDPGTFAAMATVMMLVGLLASYVPARRASAVDPLESMRME